MSKGQNELRKQSENIQENSLTIYEKSLEDLVSQKKYSEVLEKINETEKNFAGETEVRKVHIRIKDKIIDAKINEKKELFDTEKYEEIVNFLYQLRYIHPVSKKIEKLLRKYRSRLLDQQLENKQDFVFRSKENIKNLILLGKFEFAIEACEDLIRVDPRSLFARKTILDCEAKLRKLLRQSMYEQIMSRQEPLTREMLENPDQFIEL